MTKKELKILIKKLYYGDVNEKIKTQIIPQSVKKHIEEHTSFYSYDQKEGLN